MLKEALASAEFAMGPTAALVIFFVFMLLVGLWLLRPGASARYRSFSTAIFDEQAPDSRHGKGAIRDR